MGEGKCSGGLYLVTTDRLLTERFLLTAFRCRLRAGRVVPVQQSLLSEPSTLHVTPGGVRSTETINPVRFTKNQLVKQCGSLQNSLSFGRGLDEKSMYAKTEFISCDWLSWSVWASYCLTRSVWASYCLTRSVWAAYCLAWSVWAAYCLTWSVWAAYCLT